MRVSSILSLVGVLSAGSAAAVVNNEVLQHGGNADATVGVSVDADAQPATRIDSATLTATQVMFQIREAGFVTLDTAGDALTIVSVTVNSGWQLVDSRVDGSSRVDLLLQHGNDTLAFNAQLVGDGGVVATVDPTPQGPDGVTGGAEGDASTDGRVDGSGSGVSGSGSGGANGTVGNGADDADDSTNDADDADDADDCASDADVSVCVDGEVGVDLNDD